MKIKYPVGIQSFPKLIEGGFLYVDKTRYIHRLAEDGGYYFLARPRRFGKSLLLSTIEAYYQGRRDLFRGLAIDRLTRDWEPHPVLHLDLNNRNYRDEASLIKELNENLERWEALYGDEKRDRDVEERFAYVIRKAYEKTGKKVIILVDEYDKPMLSAITNPELSETYTSILKAFYSNLKTMDEYIGMALLTGVARFSKVSIFSDLNNLRDISFEKEFSAICGITHDELTAYFTAGLGELADEWHETVTEVISTLEKHYDGYHFSKNGAAIFNPFSLISVFTKKEPGSYWFDSGTPTYLVNFIRKINRPFSRIAPVEVLASYLETAGLLGSDPVPAFYQSGYLTIKGYDPFLKSYTLDYPNEEVKEGFLNFLMREYIPDMVSGYGFSITDFVQYVRNGQPEEFMKSMESLIAGVPYIEKGSAEAHFQNAIYLLFTLLGYYTRMEDRTSDGRIDLSVETPERVYIFEFKINGSAEQAMYQIKDRKYWLKYARSGKQIYLIGASFSTSTRRLDDYVIERI